MEQTDKALRQALEVLPGSVKSAVLQEETCAATEEIRLRAGQKVHIKYLGLEYVLDTDYISAEELRQTVSRAARFSLHSYADDMRSGFLTLEGGHRLGVAGRVSSENGKILAIREISSLNLRIARAQENSFSACLLFEKDVLRNTLVLSPPGFGKTTLLRDLARQLSCRGKTVCIADERCEIAALREGVPQFDIGPCTDVLDGCCKREATAVFLKTASPSLLVLDEITTEEDLRAVEMCAYSGVAVLAAVHAAGIEELRRRPVYRKLLNMDFFQCAIVIEMDGRGRKYQLKPLKREERTC